MKITLTLIFCLTFGLFSNCQSIFSVDAVGHTTTSGFYHINGTPLVIIVPNGPYSIQDGIDSLPPEGGTVYVKSGLYELSQRIHISRSNVAVVGEPGTLLRLQNNVNQPVFLVGTDKFFPTVGDTIFNIRVANLEIDGNKAQQTSEVMANMTWIRNNGIDVRMVKNMWIEDVNVHDARSGGAVVSWFSSKIFISNSCFNANSFDGIALYTSDNIQVSNFMCFNNLSAGLSLDNDLRDVSFNGGIIKDNHKLGIFARDSEDLSFYNLMIKGNGEDGCFVSHDGSSPNSGIKRLFFQGCSFLDNARHGFWMASTTAFSPNNAIIGCLFGGNAMPGSGSSCDGINISPGGSIDESANICQ